MSKNAADALNDKPLHAYDTAEMKDPLVRCYACAKLVAVEFIRNHAGCNHCGNKRFNFLYLINEDEMKALRDQSYDLGISDYQVPPAFLDIFQETNP